MGGAIGVVAGRRLPDLAGFISVEGNLIADDCGLVSRGVAEQSADDFKERGFSDFVRWLEHSPDRSHQEWVKWYRQCDPRGLHGLASSLVHWCDHGDLAAILGSLGPSAYVHGSQSEIAHLRDVLGHAMYPVDGAGHFRRGHPWLSARRQLAAEPASRSPGGRHDSGDGVAHRPVTETIIPVLVVIVSEVAQ
ncbi:hypothetical protein [Actinoplanes sp. G11-F43]|uniref:hypothetical protein n=1 Tax=Actinoplanes sp. G11-F43 TaxID=3424130 RepID=UPI003D34148B